MPANREYTERLAGIYRALPLLRKEVDAGVAALHRDQRQARQALSDALETLRRRRIMLWEIDDLLDEDRTDTRLPAAD